MAKINFKWPLKIDREGAFTSNQTTIGAVREDLKTLLLTTPGERVINRSLGTNLSSIGGQLFEPTDVDAIKNFVTAEVEHAINAWMPHLSLVEIDVSSGIENKNLKENEVLIRIVYSLNSQQTALDSIQLRVTI